MKLFSKVVGDMNYMGQLLKKFYNKIVKIFHGLLRASSFFLVTPCLVYLIYYLLVCYDLSKVVGGSIVVCVLIYLNKSLN